MSWAPTTRRRIQQIVNKSVIILVNTSLLSKAIYTAALGRSATPSTGPPAEPIATAEAMCIELAHITTFLRLKT